MQPLAPAVVTCHGQVVLGDDGLDAVAHPVTQSVEVLVRRVVHDLGSVALADAIASGLPLNVPTCW